MTEYQYQQKRRTLERKYKIQIKELALLYIELNNPYKEGDVFIDHVGWIEITSVQYSLHDLPFPICYFYGFDKSGHERIAYLTNEKK